MGTPTHDRDKGRPPPSRPDADRAWNRGARNTALEVLFGVDRDEEGRLAEGEYLAATTIIELKGARNASFVPAHDSIAYYIQQAGAGGVSFEAQFDGIAQGHIVIFWDGRAYQADRYWALPIQSRELKSRDARSVVLLVGLTDGKFHGLISTISGVALGAGLELRVGENDHDVEGLKPVLFGRSYHGPDSLDARWKNWLKDGALWLVCDFLLRPPDGPAMTGLTSFIDGDFRFMAHANLSAEGAEVDQVVVDRTPSGILHATPNIKFAESWQMHGITASFETSFFDGSFEGRGRVKLRYPDEPGKSFVEGELNVVLTTEEKAWAAAKTNDPSPDLTGGLLPFKPSGGGLALVAWGRLDLKLAPGAKKYKLPDLKATAMFVVDPEGHLTARGILRMPREYILLPAERFGGDPLIDFSVTEGAQIYGPFGGEVTVYAKVKPYASIGPFSLRDLVAEGTYSTRSDVGTQLKIKGAFNASAEAGVEAKAGVKMAVTVGINTPSWFPVDLTADVASVDAGVSGTAVIRGYAEATPEIKMDKPAADAAAGPAQYSISGRLEVAGEAVLTLDAGLGLSVGSWKKAATMGTEYTLGRGGVAVDIKHVFGSDEHPKPQFSFTGFDRAKFVKDMLSGTPRAPSGRKFKGSFKEKGRRAVDAIEGEAPAVPPLPDRAFDLHVPFTIKGKQHQLVLVIAPGGSQLVLVRSPGERVAIKPKAGIVGEALEFAEHMLQGARTTDDLEFYERQVADLRELFGDALALEEEADRFGPDVEHLEAEDITDLDEYASDVVEYAQRYGDYTLEGHGRLLSAPFEDPGVGLLGPERFTVLGASRVGATHEFRGSFDDREWKWTAVPGHPKDFPSRSVTKHPINDELGLRTANYLSDLRPADDYHFIPGLKTPGAESIKDELQAWRDRLGGQATERTEKLDAERGRVDRQQARWDAEGSIAYDWKSKGYPHHRYDVLLVLKHTGWFCHHIREHSWGSIYGDDNNRKDNLIYLAKDEHDEITEWFVNREKHINRQLDIYEQKKP
jgi:hypothetical protein